MMASISQQRTRLPSRKREGLGVGQQRASS